LFHVPKRLVFRWTLWGKWSTSGLAMLHDSVASFHVQFPNGTFVASYRQDDDLPDRRLLPEYLQWHSLPGETGILPGDELWLKWFPQDLVDAADLFIAVDADVFAVADPVGLRKWMVDELESSICCMQESNPQPWQYGNYADRFARLPVVNAGFVASREAAVFTQAMMWKYQHYTAQPSLQRRWHDEQGAVAEYWLEQESRARASFLPEATNKLLCPSANAEVIDIQGLEIIHTPYPEHPKYYELKEQIRAAIARG